MSESSHRLIAASQGEFVIFGLFLVVALLLLGASLVLVLAVWRGEEIRRGQFGYWRTRRRHKPLTTNAKTGRLRSKQ